MMRNLLLILILPFLFLACSKGGEVEIKFNISNKKSKEIKIYVLDDEYSIGVDESGRAIKNIEIPEKTYAYVYLNNRVYVLYLTPDKKLEVSLDANDRSGRIFLYCDDKGINSYLAIERNISYGDESAFYRLNEESYLRSLRDKIKRKREYLENRNLPADFVKIEKERIAYKALEDIFFYPSYRKFFYKKKDYIPSDAYNNFIDSMFVQNPELLEIQSYKDFLIRYVEKKTLKVKAQKGRIGRISGHVDYVHSNVNVFEISDFLINAFIYPYIERYGIEDTGSLIEMYNENVKNLEYRKKFNSLVKRYKNIEMGQISPSFILKDINKKDVSLEDLRGKYIYIEVWASWCSPCRNELDYFQRLAKEYKDRRISFVGISLDENYEQWQSFVKRKKIQGIQLFAGKDASFSKDYVINTIPRFILIDKNGKIVDSKIVRPSSKDIRGILNNLSGI